MSFEFAAVDRFVNRSRDLAALGRWWTSDDRNALNLHGRRRVGKSWLFRRFAHGKDATVLVADRLAPGAQLSRLAAQLEDALGVRPQIDDVADLFRLLYRLGAERPHLVVLDEFPYLLPPGSQREVMLTAIQSVMEVERDRSQTKLVLCGSHVQQMQALTSEGSALRGRLTTLRVDPLAFGEAGALIEDSDPQRRIERFAVAGGMARYLSELGSGGPLDELICTRLLDPNGALFNDPREVLEHELAQVATYFSILQELAGGEKALGEIASALRMPPTNLPRPLDTLREMAVIERRIPVSASAGEKSSRYRISDPFLRFWFQFVFPYQEDLSAGLAPRDLYGLEIEPVLTEHVAPVFETLCREWVRRNRGSRASRVGSWWGPTTKSGNEQGRFAEEIDIVGLGRGRATVIGECKWTNKPLSVSILADLEDFKLPALRQGGVKVAGDVEIVLFCRGGFTDGLTERAEADSRLTLVGLDELVAGLGLDQASPGA
jgi:AAA+ ATPase superfamily predicted ATPase